MKSASSYFKPSHSLIKENFRQFWAIPVISFAFYFLSGVFPILLNFGKFEVISDATNLTLANVNPFFVIINIVAPICAAVAVFRYLHNQASVTALHAMPFSRSTLYCSSVISGWLLVIVPVILTGLLFMATSGAGPSLAYMPENEYPPVDNLECLTIVHSIMWMIDTIITASFVYAISVFAGIIAGTSLIHTLLCLFFNGLPFVLTAIVESYLKVFLFGFSYHAKYSYFSPLSYDMRKARIMDKQDITIELMFIAIAVALLIISAFLYRKIKLERESDTTVFKLADEILCYLVAFIGMTVIGMIVKENLVGKTSMVMFFVGAAIGAVSFFTIARMIVEKTVKVFHKINLKKFGIFIIIAAIFFAFTVFDVTGFQKRVPELKKVESVRIRDMASINDVVLKDTDSIKKVISYQNFVVNLDSVQTDIMNSADANATTNITIEYSLTNGKKIKRDYTYFATFGSEIDNEFQIVYDSKEFKEKSMKQLLDHPDADEIELALPSGEFKTLSKSKMQQLLNACKTDYMAKSYSETRQTLKLAMSDYSPYYINFNYKIENGYNNKYSYAIYPTDENAMNFIKENGIYQDQSALKTELKQ